MEHWHLTFAQAFGCVAFLSRTSNCEMLEIIVEDSRDKGTSDTNQKVITLFQLSYLVLKDLPNPKTFILSVEIDQLTFFFFFLKYPLLKVYISSENQKYQAVLHRKKYGRFKGQGSFWHGEEDCYTFSAASIILVDMPNLKSFHHIANCHSLIHASEVLQVDNCAVCSQWSLLDIC